MVEKICGTGEFWAWKGEFFKTVGLRSSTPYYSQRGFFASKGVRGVAKFLAPPYYSQCAVCVSPSAFSLIMIRLKNTTSLNNLQPGLEHGASILLKIVYGHRQTWTFLGWETHHVVLYCDLHCHSLALLSRRSNKCHFLGTTLRQNGPTCDHPCLLMAAENNTTTLV